MENLDREKPKGGGTEGENVSKFEQMFRLYNLHLHDEIVQMEARTLLERHRAENDSKEVKRLLLSCLELTSLTVTDTEESVLAMTEKVNRLSEENPQLPHMAGMCVYPRFVKLVSQSLEVDGMELSTVTGGFPSAQTFAEVKLAETALALHDGATEIDTVLPVGMFLSEDYEGLSDEMAELKEACGKEARLKVILETGALKTATNVKKAALLAMYSGADFIKTSTGKVSPGATTDAVYTMCRAIGEYYDKTGIKVGIKIAGGVRTAAQAVDYYTIVKETLGREWLDPTWLRIGASGLANNLLSEISGKSVEYF